MRYEIHDLYEPSMEGFRITNDGSKDEVWATNRADAECIKSALEMRDKLDKMANHHPVNDQVIVKQHKRDAVVGGIILPEKVRDKLWCGTVVACGPGKLLTDGARKMMQVKVGDVVYFHWDNNRIEIDREEYLSMKEETILAVVD